MMYGRGKSSPVIVAGSRRTKHNRIRSLRRSRWSEGQGPRGMRTSLHAPDSVPGLAWSWRWLAYVKPQGLIVSTRGGNRMRESCTYGSVRGARGNSRPYRDFNAASSSRSSAAWRRGRSRHGHSSRRSRSSAVGLAEIGFLEGRDVTVGCHTAEGHHQGDAETARRLETTMANSKTIAGLIGPTLIALAAGLLIN